METKKCTRCGEVKPLTEFYLFNKKGKNKKIYSLYCKVCYTEYQRERRRQKAAELPPELRTPDPNKLLEKHRREELAAVELRLQGIAFEMTYTSVMSERFTALLAERNRLLIRKRQLENPIERADRVMTVGVRS